MSDCQELYELNKKEQRQQQLSASLESNRSSHSSGAKTLDGGEVLFHTCLSPGGGALQRPPCVGKARWGLGITEAARTQGAKMLKKKKGNVEIRGGHCTCDFSSWHLSVFELHVGWW